MKKRIKFVFFALLSMASSFYFGLTCFKISLAYSMLISPSMELLDLLISLLAGISAVVITAAFVAVLLKPAWAAMIAFACSGFALYAGWGMATGSNIMALAYVLATSLYALGVSKDMDERISFSTQSIGRGQHMLIIVVVAIACASVYLGTSGPAEKISGIIPRLFTNIAVDHAEKQVLSNLPTRQNKGMLDKFRADISAMVEKTFKNMIDPYKQYIGLALAVILFMPLLTICSLLAWVWVLIIKLIFILLKAVGVTELVAETKQVQRLVLAE
ncbi:hypothetical protein ACFL6Y_12075 [Elusimicrobiota bacterium]